MPDLPLELIVSIVLGSTYSRQVRQGLESVSACGDFGSLTASGQIDRLSTGLLADPDRLDPDAAAEVRMTSSGISTWAIFHRKDMRQQIADVRPKQRVERG